MDLVVDLAFEQVRITLGVTHDPLHLGRIVDATFTNVLSRLFAREFREHNVAKQVLLTVLTPTRVGVDEPVATKYDDDALE